MTDEAVRTARAPAAQKSGCPPAPATTRPPMRSTLTVPSRPTCSAVFTATKRGCAASRLGSCVSATGTRRTRPAAASVASGSPAQVYAPVAAPRSSPRCASVATASVSIPDQIRAGRSSAPTTASPMVPMPYCRVGSSGSIETTLRPTSRSTASSVRSFDARGRGSGAGISIAPPGTSGAPRSAAVSSTSTTTASAPRPRSSPSRPNPGTTTLAPTTNAGHHEDVGPARPEQRRHRREADGDVGELPTPERRGQGVAAQHGPATHPRRFLEPWSRLGGEPEEHVTGRHAGELADLVRRTARTVGTVGVDDQGLLAHDRRRPRNVFDAASITRASVTRASITRASITRHR